MSVKYTSFKYFSLFSFSILHIKILFLGQLAQWPATGSPFDKIQRMNRSVGSFKAFEVNSGREFGHHADFRGTGGSSLEERAQT